MAVLPVDLDSTPDDIASLLAVDAAVRAAVGLDHHPPAPGALHWADDAGMWMALLRPGDGRALLVGWHPEFSLTEGGGNSREAGTDLVGDAPGWWRRGVEHARSRNADLGFLYGWDGSRWWRLDQPADDGFDPELFPVTRAALRDIVDELADDTLLDAPDPDAVETLLTAGSGLTAADLAAVLHAPDGWPEVDLDAGARAAHEHRSAVTA
ncbi:hypothetical protein [Dietzia sp. ANT_WB102]|uniref:hypothetical protein n=1 Tax=Dietzia sp. ANT_WB102 TaxID=2597345 RepID=UPI0011EFFC83|nr:hypothetical protein [Dietzia sp. ANT_WB102]KAA0918074.1 hypothetical protein FQ137_01375 [Dietzia sp. ANT_WB102]